MAEVFVSYSRVNRDRIVGLGDALEESGHSVWWDRALAPGDDYAMLIEKEIGAARCCVVAWSKTARESLWVRAEANEALDSGKLVQIKLDDSKPPLPFTALSLLDFSSWGGSRAHEPWDALDSRVRRRLNGEWIDDKAPPPGPALQGLGRVSMLGWVSILVAGLAALAVGLAATGTLSPAAFGGLTLFALAVAAVLLAATAFSLVRIQRASRR
jgi:TIR domain-containing protein